MDRDIALQVRTAPWAALAHELLAEGDVTTRCSIAALAAASCEAALIRELGGMIADDHQQVRDAAEQAIADLARRVDASQGGDVADVLAEVLIQSTTECDSPRQRNVLGVILRRWGTAAGLAELTRLSITVGKATWLDDAAHPVQMGLRSLLRRDADATVASAAIVWLRLDSLASACRDRLLQPGTSNDHAAILAGSHLLAHPARDMALAELSQHSAKRTHPRDLIWAARHDAIAALPTSKRVFAPAFLRKLPVSFEHLAACLADSIADPSPVVRHAAIRAIADEQTNTRAATKIGTATDGQPLKATLTDLCFDAHPRVALAAARTKLRLDPPLCSPTSLHSSSAGPIEHPSTIWRHLARSEHAAVRRFAQSTVDRFDTGDPTTAAGMLATRRLLRREPARVIAELKAQLADESCEARIIGIRLAMRLGIVQDIEVELVRLVWAGSSDLDEASQVGARHVAATAVIALSALDSHAARNALRTSLSHDDPRVRSNAIESLSKQARRLGPAAVAPAWLEDTIIDCKNDLQHRVRATAAWLLALRRSLGIASVRREAWSVGVATAGAMIRDDRTEHALAGLWLTERLAAHGLLADHGTVTNHLGELLQHHDLHVRGRAVRCLQRLTGETDEDWLRQQAELIGVSDDERSGEQAEHAEQAYDAEELAA